MADILKQLPAHDFIWARTVHPRVVQLGPFLVFPE